MPKGRWTILRVGYTPTGVDNHPAAWGGVGLECDKFSKTALDAHWDGFMQKILDDIGPLAGKTLDCSLIDSYEVGGQNWTKNFRREFERLRGYDPLKFLPAFTGRVVDNPEVSERFLWDVRRTIADLFAENYYGHFAELCRRHGLMSAVEYSLDGRSRHATVQEGDMLTLPATSSTGEAPQWETSIAAAGSPVVTAWSDGCVKFRTADGKILRAVAADIPAPQNITGAWKLSFPPNWGAPSSVTLEKLISWTDHPDAGVRYFSGTASYEKAIEISADRLSPGRELWLDLGVLKDFAQVSLNGHDFGVLWKPPFRVNLTHAAKPGVNMLMIEVTNLWPNRLIGDEHLPPDCRWDGKRLAAWPQWLLEGKPSPTGRFTFTTWHHDTKDSPLLESGLLGPVTLRTAETIPAN